MIKCSAIIYQGKIYEGTSHPKIGLKMIEDEVCPRPYPGGKAQGFVTETGEFVNRDEALCIAVQAGQVVAGQTSHKNKLFSEDLRINSS